MELDELGAMRTFPAERVRLCLRHILEVSAEPAHALLLRPRRAAQAETKQKNGKRPHRNPPKQLSAAPYHSAGRGRTGKIAGCWNRGAAIRSQRITPHPVPLPMGEETPEQRMRRGLPLPQGEGWGEG